MLGIRYITTADLVPSEIFFMDQRAALAVVAAAFIGGIVSIATRLGEFAKVRDMDPFSMFWTAMLKPLIGVALSLFLLATLAGGIISFGFLDASSMMSRTEEIPKALYVLFALGFLMGFSERFAWDFVDRARGVASGGPGGADGKGR
jgi:hypothetical protein